MKLRMALPQANKRIILALSLIVLLGFTLRAYNLGFPSIGYHNMKENEYLSMAEEMRRTGDFITRRVYFYNGFEENPEMKIFPQPPVVAYQILLSWKIFGDNLWAPRLFNVFFGLLSILVIYFIGKIIFKDREPALVVAFLLAVMPLGVFFSRNLQPESPGFFFILLGTMFYLRFITCREKYNLFLGGLSFSISWLYKFNFIFAALPFIFCFPLAGIGKDKKNFFKYLFSFSFPYLVVFIATFFYLYHIGQWQFQSPLTTARIRLFDIFHFSYWQAYGNVIWKYVKGENYGLVFSVLTFLGIIIALVKRKGLLDRYIIGNAFVIIAYSMAFSDFINQHNYYQMPFLGLVCIASVYGLWFMAQSLARFGKRNSFPLLFVIVMGISTPEIYRAIRGMYNTVFIGADVAGKTLKSISQPGDRIFLLAYCQGYGIARYAQRYAGWPSSLGEFKYREKQFKIKYIAVYPFFMLNSLRNQTQVFNYIRENYHPKEWGLSQENNSLNTVYLILEKNEGIGPDKVLRSSSSSEIKLAKVYHLWGREIPFYVMRPEWQNKKFRKR